jgi:hypothetical protein
MRQPIIPNCPVVTLDISILLGLAGLDEIDADSLSGSLSQGHGANVFRTVVTADRIRFAAPFDNPVQRPDDTFRWQREVDFDSQAFPIEVIYDVEQADAASVGELIMHEVHRPALVDSDRHGQRQRFLAHETMAWLDPQVQLKLAINPVDTFMVPFKTFYVTQIQEAQPEVPIALVVRQPYQPVGNDVVFCVQLGLVPVARLTDAECLAGQLDRG